MMYIGDHYPAFATAVHHLNVELLPGSGLDFSIEIWKQAVFTVAVLCRRLWEICFIPCPRSLLHMMC